MILDGAFESSRDESKQTDRREGNGARIAPRPLVRLGSKSSLDRWVECLRRCPEISSSDGSGGLDAFVVTNAETHDAYVEWSVGSSGGIDRGNVLNSSAAAADAAAAGGGRSGTDGDAIFALERFSETHDHVLLIDGSRTPVPGFDLACFIRNALARGKNAAVRGGAAAEFRFAASESASESAGGVAPRPDEIRVLPIERVQPRASERGEVLGAAACALLRKESLPLLRRFFEEEDGDSSNPAPRTLVRFLRRLARREPFEALKVPHGEAFALETAEDIAFAERFYEFYDETHREALRAVQPPRRRGSVAASEPPSGRALAEGVPISDSGAARRRALTERFAAEDARAGDIRKRAMDAAMDVDVLLPMFIARWNQDARGGEGAFGPAGAPAEPPPRFRAPQTDWDVAKNKVAQHPCYVTTSSSAYGHEPTAADMPLRWHGVNSRFTRGFAGNRVDSGLVTRREKSKVLDAREF